MSRTLDYFPPIGTKLKWHPKALNYSPWVCRMWDEWPACITLDVDKNDEEEFTWRVDWRNFNKEKGVIHGKERTAREACLAAEAAGKSQKALIWKPWMATAIKAKWRPPA